MLTTDKFLSLSASCKRLVVSSRKTRILSSHEKERAFYDKKPWA